MTTQVHTVTGRPMLALTKAQARRFATEVEVLRLTPTLNRSPRWWCENALGLSREQAHQVLVALDEVES